MSSAHPGEVPADPAVASLECEILALEVLSPNDRLDAFEAAVVLEERARALGLSNLMHRARLIGAVAQGRRGQLAASARVIREVNRWAIEHQDSYLLARSHRHLSHVTRLLGDFAISLEHAVRAVELTTEDFPAQVRFEHEHVLAIALARAGDPAAASRRFAILDADPALDEQPWLRVSVLNNMAFMAVQNGRFDEALTAAERMVATAEDHDLTLQAAYVDTYCQVMLAAGTPETAVTFMDQRLHELEGSSDVDSVADCYLTLAQAQRLTGRLQAAHETLDRASRLARARDLVEIQARVKAERAELYAAQGRYQDAFEEHKRYSAAMAVLNSIERDGRAKIAAAVFETAEARRETERFRALSQMDPLTGLRNRRYVDEQLPTLLRATAERGEPLTVALLDLDHFKRVNDEYSHEVGDQVLINVGRVLSEYAAGVGFAARLGGEEFLLVLPNYSRNRAVQLCYDLRSRLHHFDWSSLHPAMKSVTASIGLGSTELVPVADQANLLRTADANLYRAKRAGRDQVKADAVPLVGAQRRTEPV